MPITINSTHTDAIDKKRNNRKTEDLSLSPVANEHISANDPLKAAIIHPIIRKMIFFAFVLLIAETALSDAMLIVPLFFYADNVPSV